MIDRVHKMLSFLRFTPALQAEVKEIETKIQPTDVETYVVAITELELLYDHPDITNADWFTIGRLKRRLTKAARKLLAFNAYKAKSQRDRTEVASAVRQHLGIAV